MKSIQNLLQWINDNWASIVTIAVLLFAIYNKATKTIKDWQAKSKEEKEKAQLDAIEKAKAALSEFILSFVAKAEIDWNSNTGLGPIKRAQVIDEIYTKYPILLQVADKDELLKYIDSLIDNALKTVRDKLRTADTTSNTTTG